MEYDRIKRRIYFPEAHYHKDKYIYLTELEFRIFDFLWNSKDHFATYDELCKELFEEEADMLNKENLRVSTTRLRKRSKYINIINIRKNGYKLII